jgi:phosphoribosyl-ATP pyrophosphohydrolase/phosphoribosyl-AMP cyclohydrolase
MKPDFSKGLLPAVVQDATTGDVLMVAYMDEEAWARTRESGRAWFHSRERGLWEKGATSGNTMEVVQVRLDCDLDTILLRVNPAGPACHTRAVSCFFNEVDA